MGFLRECRDFFHEFRHSFHTTGSILPSSRFLARALASELAKPRGPCRVLEVGPGTGAVTRAILRRLQPGDRLDVVEINDRFVTLLQQRFEREPDFNSYKDQVRIIHAPVEELAGEAMYDFIISGLPLNNFPVSQVRSIFRTFRRLLKPDGVLSYFEYLLIRQLKTPFVGRRERGRLYRVGRVAEVYIRKYQVRAQQVFWNVPPATARHLRLKAAEVAADTAS